MQVIIGKDGWMESVTFLRPSNFHAHLRRAQLMQAMAKIIMQYVLYLLVMPNTGPIRTMEEALKYYDELMEIAEREGLKKLRLIMTLYHTKDITISVIEEIANSTIVRAIKHYPPHPGATTGSGFGMALEDSDYQFEAMAANGVPLLGHFEAVVDKYNRPLDPKHGEAHMVREHLWRLRDKHPNLRICFEHVSTKEGVDWVKADTSGNTVATITPHHPFFNEGDLEREGPDLKCKPTVQTPENQEAVTDFMVSGDPRAISGDDDAPHPSKTKHVSFEDAANGCALPHAIPMYANKFIERKAMDQRFENFMSLNGPRWWGLEPPANDDTITIVRSDDDMPEPIPIPGTDDVVVPLGWRAGADRLRLGLAVKG
ncbi:MAG: dihydroorotase [Parcubacteria group bacterium]|nr:dihydroorotase [Parcubacteria group bacterium]